MNEKISEIITKRLLMGLGEEKLTYIKLHFYIESILSETEKIIVLLILFGIVGKIRSLLLIYIVAILVRRYSGGNHCMTFVACLFYSVIICFGIVVLARALEYVDDFIMCGVVFFHVLIMIMFAPIKSNFRPTLKKEDVIQIKIKGVLGILIVSTLYYILNTNDRKIIFLTLLFLLIDEMVACCLYYLKMKGVIGDEENNS